MRHVHPIYHPSRKVLDFESAVLLGLHAGDGWISGRWGIAAHSKDKRMISEVIKLVRDVLGVEPSVATNSDHTTAIMSQKRQVIQFFKKYGFPEGRKSSTVKVPSAVFTSSSEVKRGFLRGLFSADGCFYKEGFRGECRMEVASKPLRDGFVLLSSDLGFGFRKYSYVHHGGHNKLPLHVAYLGRQPDVIRWMREVGSICDAHVKRFRLLMRSNKNRK